jgi:hypothetical protein
MALVVQLGLGGLLVGLGDLHPLAGLEQVRDRPQCRDVGDRGVLVDHRNLDGPAGQVEDRLAQYSAERPAQGRQHVTECFVEVSQVERVADHLPGVVRLGRPDSPRLAVDVEPSDLEQLAVGEGALLGFVQGQATDGLPWGC